MELFRLMKHEKEFYREIFIFLISHDYNLVRIYGYYPFIDRNKISFYRHLIHKFDFIVLESKKK
jgi:hypothetical protein